LSLPHLLRQSIVPREWSVDEALRMIRNSPPSRTMDCRNKSGNDNIGLVIAALVAAIHRAA
jgi:hypothetical protein